MSLRFPDLSLERWEKARSTSEPPSPLALAAREGSREIVVAVNAAASERGVRPGQSVTAARALCSALEIRPDEPEKDARLLAGLAATMLRYTPDVVLDPFGSGSALLLEIGRTAFHFGGEEALVRRAEALAASLGHRSSVAVAPRAAAASAFSRAAARSGAGGHALLAGDEDLRSRIAALPWSVLEPSESVTETCRLLALTTIGDLLALPRGGLAARLGTEMADRLARLVGERDEPLPRIRPAARLRDEIEWWPPSTEQSSLLFVAKRLFDLVEATLGASGHGVQEVEITCTVADTRETVALTLRPTRPTHRSATLSRLLQHRLEGLKLPGPVDRMSLHVLRQAPLHIEQGLLFEDEVIPAWSEEAVQLLDRLSSRLGEARVLAPSLTAEHRPELAFTWRRPGAGVPSSSPAPPTGRRPLELDHPPRLLDVAVGDRDEPSGLAAGRERGALRVVTGPERLESGWWDGGDAQRLYYEVETATGARWWVFRDLRMGRWFRHGIFG